MCCAVRPPPLSLSLSLYPPSIPDSWRSITAPTPTRLATRNATPSTMQHRRGTPKSSWRWSRTTRTLTCKTSSAPRRSTPPSSAGTRRRWNACSRCLPAHASAVSARANPCGPARSPGLPLSPVVSRCLRVAVLHRRARCPRCVAPKGVARQQGPWAGASASRGGRLRQCRGRGRGAAAGRSGPQRHHLPCCV